MILIPLIAASATGSLVYYLACLFKPVAPFIQAPFVPVPAQTQALPEVQPAPVAPQEEVFSNVIVSRAIDPQGFPQGVLTDSISQSSQRNAPPPAPAAAVQDTFRDPVTSLSNQNGPPPEEVVEPQSFFDSLNPFS